MDFWVEKSENKKRFLQIKKIPLHREGRQTGDICRLEYEKVLKKVYHLFTKDSISDKCD